MQLSLVALTLSAVMVCCANAQFFAPLQQQVPVASLQPMGVPHRAVVLNAEAEARLPANLQNPFYRNPRIGAALAKESWFTPGEQQVLEREADKIPREKIFSILKHAGLARRR